MSKRPFYTEGLHFSCTRCSACCRYDPGYVFLSKNDLESLIGELKLGYTEFVETYCRWIPGKSGAAYLSLKEKSNFDCIFWREGCSVYQVRPLQCRTFPFWPDYMRSQEAWNHLALSCPGIGKGTLHSVEYIELCIDQQLAESIIIEES